MTVREAANDLLGYLEPEKRVYPPASTEDNPLPSVLSAINGGLHELTELGPLWQFRDRRSARTRIPVTITIPSITQDASTFTLATGPFAAWMVGCSIMISGETVWNEIVSYTVTTVKLLHPVTIGYGSNVTAIVYSDSLNLDSDVLQVLPPVSVADSYELSPAKNLSELHSISYDYWRSADYGRSATLSHARRRTDSTPAPRFYWVDTYYGGGAIAAALRMRLAPMPNTANIIHFRARIATPQYVTTDIYAVATPTVDPNISLPVGAPYLHTVLMPIIRKRFMSSPLFRNDNAVAGINEDYTKAYKIAAERKPQSASAARFEPGY